MKGNQVYRTIRTNKCKKEMIFRWCSACRTSSLHNRGVNAVYFTAQHGSGRIDEQHPRQAARGAEDRRFFGVMDLGKVNVWTVDHGINNRKQCERNRKCGHAV